MTQQLVANDFFKAPLNIYISIKMKFASTKCSINQLSNIYINVST